MSTMPIALRSNIVSKDKLRSMQSGVLGELSDSLKNSFGPMGSHTCIKLNNAMNQYSKDGYTILKHIHYDDTISESIREDIEEITRYITITVGDGTTSAVILSKVIFDAFVEYEKTHPETLPYQLITTFKKVVDDIKKNIIDNAKTCSVEDIYNIAMISTNGNEDIAENIKSIYAEYGMDVFIDVAISNSKDNLIKIYDGMVLKAGYADIAYTNQGSKSVIRNPRIFMFDDPVDTPEMMSFVDSIIEHNIIKPMNDGSAPIPTVIMAPHISRDLSAYMTRLCEMMIKMEQGNRPPLLIISNIHQQDEYLDLARLCGAKPIRKYIDAKIQEDDIKKGIAPTPMTLVCTSDFYGIADEVSSDAASTKVINPKSMHNEDGSNSDIYNGMIEFLEASIEKAKAEGDNANTIGNLKRRLNSLKANMVEYLIGGISASDRDNLRDLVEDAVKNCRSAADNGFGYAANFEALAVTNNMVQDIHSDKMYTDIINIIAQSYKSLLSILYSTIIADDDKLKNEIDYTIKIAKKPMNLRTKEYDESVLSSIESDVIILDTISKIVSLMFTCNQFLVPNPTYNFYDGVSANSSNTIDITK